MPVGAGGEVPETVMIASSVTDSPRMSSSSDTCVRIPAPHCSNWPSTKSLSWAVDECDERVEARNDAKHRSSPNRPLRSMPASNSSSGRMTSEPALSMKSQGGSTIEAVDDRAERCRCWPSSRSRPGRLRCRPRGQRVVATHPLVDGERPTGFEPPQSARTSDVAELVLAGEAAVAIELDRFLKNQKPVSASPLLS